MQITPYLSFPDGKAREAMEFYREHLGGELEIVSYGQGGAVEAGSEHADKVMHSALSLGAVKLYGSDWVPEFCGGRDAEFVIGDGVSITLEGGQADAERLRDAYAKLSEGGQVFMPLGKQDWGDEFGSFRDRFGQGWNISISAQGE